MLAYIEPVPALATTTDAFSALAEPRRRAILDVLRDGEMPVGAVVERTGLDQPTVSKHLRVLREAGVVRTRRDGRRRLYAIEGEAIRSVHEWARTFARYWSHQLVGAKRLAETRARDRSREDG